MNYTRKRKRKSKTEKIKIVFKNNYPNLSPKEKARVDKVFDDFYNSLFTKVAENMMKEKTKNIEE